MDANGSNGCDKKVCEGPDDVARSPNFSEQERVWPLEEYGPELKLIFIQFPHQNYTLSVNLEVGETVDTRKAKYNGEYDYHINELGPQHTLMYKGRALTVDDNLYELPKNAQLDVLESPAMGTTEHQKEVPRKDEDVAEMKNGCDDLLSLPQPLNTDVGFSKSPTMDSPDVLSSLQSSDTSVGCSKLSSMDNPHGRNETLTAQRKRCEDLLAQSSNTEVDCPQLPAPMGIPEARNETLTAQINRCEDTTVDFSKLPPMDSPEAQNEILTAVIQFFSDFKKYSMPTRYKSYNTRKSKELSTKYATFITSDSWIPFVHSLALHLATDPTNNDQTLQDFRALTDFQGSGDCA